MKFHTFPLHAVAATMFFAFCNPATAQTQNTTYSYLYDANGNLTQITDPLGRITNQNFDALNRLVKQTLPLPATGVARPTISTNYDGQGQITSVVDPRNLVTNYVVDGLGNLTQLQSPDTGVTNKTYDLAGNLLTQTDAKGQSTQYSYDALNRVASITYADSNAVSYTYDQGPNGVGRLTQIGDVNGSIQYSYDQNGHLLTEVRTLNSIPYTTSYNYDNAGDLAGIIYPSGRTLIYTRDAMGRISQIDCSKNGTVTTVVKQVSYQAFGGIQSYVNGAGRTISRSFDLDGRINSYTLNNQTKNLGYDAASNITSLTDVNNVNTMLSYDGLNRLTSSLTPTSSRTYGYDANGNRISQVTGAASNSLSYSSASNKLIQIAGAQVASYGTDANGSITNNGNSQFSYDARGRMTSAVTSAGNVQFTVNALGQRVQKITPNGTTLFHYDAGGKLIGEVSGSIVKDYIYLDDTLVAIFQK